MILAKNRPPEWPKGSQQRPSSLKRSHAAVRLEETFGASPEPILSFTAPAPRRALAAARPAASGGGSLASRDSQAALEASLRRFLGRPSGSGAPWQEPLAAQQLPQQAQQAQQGRPPRDGGGEASSGVPPLLYAAAATPTAKRPRLEQFPSLSPQAPAASGGPSLSLHSSNPGPHSTLPPTPGAVAPAAGSLFPTTTTSIASSTTLLQLLQDIVGKAPSPRSRPVLGGGLEQAQGQQAQRCQQQEAPQPRWALSRAPLYQQQPQPQQQPEQQLRLELPQVSQARWAQPVPAQPDYSSPFSSAAGALGAAPEEVRHVEVAAQARDRSLGLWQLQQQRASALGPGVAQGGTGAQG